MWPILVALGSIVGYELVKSWLTPSTQQQQQMNTTLFFILIIVAILLLER